MGTETPMDAIDNGIEGRDTQLFGDDPRNFASPSLRAESIYSSLNRSSHPDTVRLRNMLQRWVDRLPFKVRSELVSSIKHKGRGSKKEDRGFNATFFELVLHEFFIGTGSHVEVHPPIGRGHPDFRVIEQSPGGSQIIYVVEATDIDVESGTTLERDWNELNLYDWINEIYSPDFYLDLTKKGKLSTLPSKQRVKGPFEELIKETNYESLLEVISACGYSREVLPSAQVQHDNWLLTGWLWPVDPQFRPKSGGLISFYPGRSGQFLDDIRKTRDRLEAKARQRKGVDNLIIALRCSPTNNRIDEALFGRHGVVYKPQIRKPQPFCPTKLFRNRRKDGFWLNNSGPRNQRVIGVAVFRELHPWSIVESRAVFYSNPYVEKPMPAWTKAISHADYSDGDLKIVEGVPVTAFVRDFEDVGNLSE